VLRRLAERPEAATQLHRTVWTNVVSHNESDSQQRTKSEISISKGWVQGVALVLVFGFFVMGVLAYRTYTESMPLPEKVVGEDAPGVRLDRRARRIPRP
jgi:hypothetical protein